MSILKKPSIIPNIIWANKEGFMIGLIIALVLVYTPLRYVTYLIPGMIGLSDSMQKIVSIIVITTIGTLIDLLLNKQK